jgi:FG-GAP-like repeat
MSVLENGTLDYNQPSFNEHVMDQRPGGIHAVPVDLNGDGRLDIVGLLAQQFETVVAYINTGKAFTFDPRVIYTAPHPNWGSSGIEVVDMDGDGDLDVVLTHGDTFDDQIIKPYHGVQWLENTGRFPFEARTLAELPGVFAAKPGDVDGDGDLDVVACAFIAGGSNLDESNMPALVWLEQVKPGEFARRTLARRAPRHATLDLADVEGDGDIDIVVGNFTNDSRDIPWVELWENRGNSPASR